MELMQKLKEEAMKVLFDDSALLTREEYRELLDEIGSWIDISLDALNEEDERNERSI